MLRFLLFFLLLFSAVATHGQESDFVPLFNGKDLDGWVQAGGKAIYRVENGVIVGESVANTPNSFLCTKKLYGDFVFEYEYKCDDKLNSGVQIRSNVYAIPITIEGKGKSKSIPAGRVHGYQVEIDPNKPDRMWSGGIYDEGRRGWLFPGAAGGNAAKFTEVGKSTFKPNQWNSVRVECKGTRIRTWLNGQPRADFTDGMTPKGLIALQVHGVGKHPEAVGKTVMWRNLRIKQMPSESSGETR